MVLLLHDTKHLLTCSSKKFFFFKFLISDLSFFLSFFSFSGGSETASKANIQHGGAHPKALWSVAGNKNKCQALTRTARKALEENRCQRLQDAKDGRHRAAASIFSASHNGLPMPKVADHVRPALANTAIGDRASDEMTSSASASSSNRRTTNKRRELVYT